MRGCLLGVVVLYGRCSERFAAYCMCVWVIEAEAVLIKVNPATGGERSMRAYRSRPLGCGECLAGKDSLVRRLTLIHWTLIRMASLGLDASVITVFVSRFLPSPILPPTFFHYCCSSWAISPDLAPESEPGRLSGIYNIFGSAAALCFFNWGAQRAERKVNNIIYEEKSDGRAPPSQILSKTNRFNNKARAPFNKIGAKVA